MDFSGREVLDNEPLVRWFLTHGVSVGATAQPDQGSTGTESRRNCLDVAASVASTAVFDLFLSRGARAEESIALHAAAEAGPSDERLVMMTYLLDCLWQWPKQTDRGR